MPTYAYRRVPNGNLALEMPTPWWKLAKPTGPVLRTVAILAALSLASNLWMIVLGPAATFDGQGMICLGPCIPLFFLAPFFVVASGVCAWHLRHESSAAWVGFALVAVLLALCCMFWLGVELRLIWPEGKSSPWIFSPQQQVGR